MKHSFDLLLKELDLINATITRLDNQMQNSKRICILLLTGWLGWFISNETGLSPYHRGCIILGAAVFPILFWGMDFFWRKALRTVTRRQLRISIFLNSNNPEVYLTEGGTQKFYVLDPLGSLYEKNDFKIMNKLLKDKYIDDAIAGMDKKEKDLLKEEKISNWRVLVYKEAKWFFPSLILLPLIIGFALILCECKLCGN